MVSASRRFGARAIDLAVVFFAYIGTYWVAALLYNAVSGCADAGLTTVCGDEAAGEYVVVVVFVLGFVFPLIYESALRRTLGKTALRLEIVARDGRAASRGLRLKRSFATWAPVLLLAAGALSAPGGAGGVLATVLLFYVIGVGGLALSNRRAPWDQLLGTRVVDRDAVGVASVTAEPAEPEPPRSARRRYSKVGRRR